MNEPKGEIFIVTDEELTLCKQKASELLEHLPNEPKSALIIIALLQNAMEETLGKRLLGTKVIRNGAG